MAPPTRITLKEVMNENNQYFSDWIKDPSHVYIGPQIRKYARNDSLEESPWCHRNLSWNYRKNIITQEEYFNEYEKFIRAKMWEELDSLENKILGCWSKKTEKSTADILIKLFEERKKEKEEKEKEEKEKEEKNNEKELK